MYGRNNIKLTLPLSHIITKDNYKEIKQCKILEFKEEDLQSKLFWYLYKYEQKREFIFHSKHGIIKNIWKIEFDKFFTKFLPNRFSLYSCLLGPACEETTMRDYYYTTESKILSIDELKKKLKQNIEYAKSKLSPNIKFALENTNYYPFVTYQNICNPDFIRQVIYENDCYLLLDIAHAIVSARNMEIGLLDYFNNLPLDRVIEIHISGFGWCNNIWRDLHEIPGDVIYMMLDVVMNQIKHDPYIVIEYYKDFETIKECYERLEKYENTICKTKY